MPLAVVIVSTSVSEGVDIELASPNKISCGEKAISTGEVWISPIASRGIVESIESCVLSYENSVSLRTESRSDISLLVEVVMTLYAEGRRLRFPGLGAGV